ncbi:MAG: respiratory nitrate reductase subunit gamma [Candidatus Hydrogenedentes bacterium]|nr:respiratory nitrate reductase subunit gamma [Candidatus Hydrogenedentota bacterium]
MFDVFFFVGLPYIAVFTMVAGTIYRFRKDRLGVSSLSSQFLESKALLWGSVPWHIGIAVVFLGHLIPLLAPGVWQALVARRAFLITIETLGSCAASLCLVGLVILAIRRFASSKLQTVTTAMDLVVVNLLIAQVVLGLGVATAHRWGAVWSTGTTTPYLWSLLRFNPDVSYVAELPALVRVHLVGAFVVFLLVPFSRLVHMFSLPLEYLFRPPQKVVWANPRRLLHAHAAVAAMESRRLFLKASFGLAGAGALLSVGVFDKFLGFFRGPRMTPDEEAKLLKTRLDRLQLTVEERELELERIRSEQIFVAKVGELSPKDGKYFIDYKMRPALAFRDEQGLPRLISAKCTHLGCTVASSVDSTNRLLCPCHMSYFDVKSGAPLEGSPAKAPLPLLGWILVDPNGKTVASQGPDGKLEGKPDPATLDVCSVYIAKQYEEA